MRLVLIVALMLALAAPAQAAGRWKRLTNLAGPPLNAGRGLVVAKYGPHGVAVIGPEGVQRTYDFGPLCELRTAGGGRAVALCALESTTWYATVDLANGTMTRLDPEAVDRLDSDYGPQIVEIGARWVGVSIAGNHYGYTAYWNPQTGVVHTPFGARTTVDLDAEQVRVPLCAPVRRPRYPEGLTDVGYDSYGEVTVAGPRVFYAIYTSYSRIGLFIWRCGARKPERVTSCADSSPCAQYAADKRHLAWLQGARRVIAMDVRTGARTRFVPPKTVGKITALVLGTDNHLYVADAQGTTAVTELPSTRSASALDQT